MAGGQLGIFDEAGQKAVKVFFHRFPNSKSFLTAFLIRKNRVPIYFPFFIGY